MHLAQLRHLQHLPQIIPAGKAPAWTPAKLGSALAAWYEPGRQTGLNSGDPMTSLTDYSGAGNHAAAPVGQEPTYTINGINGKAYAQFAAVSSQYVQASFTLNQPHTRLAVAVQVYAATGAGETLFDGATGNTARFYDSASADPPAYYIYAGGFVGPRNGPSVGNSLNISSIYNGANSYNIVNGTSVGPADAGSNNPGGITIGAFGNGASAFAPINLYECAVINRVATAAELASWNQYVLRKYGF